MCYQVLWKLNEAWRRKCVYVLFLTGGLSIKDIVPPPIACSVLCYSLSLTGTTPVLGTCAHAYSVCNVCEWDVCVCSECNGNPRLCAAPLHMALLLSVWEELGLCLGVRGGRPVCLGGAGGGLKDNWRSLFRQPLVDPCRSGARVTLSKRVCTPLGLFRPFRCIQAGGTDEMVCNKLGVTLHTFIFKIWH